MFYENIVKLMTIKQLDRLLAKLRQNNEELFNTSFEIDTEWLFGIVEDYKYDDLGELIIEALQIVSESNEEDFYDVIEKLCGTQEESGDDDNETSKEELSNDKSVITQYFNEVKKVYDRYGNDFNIDFEKDDREKVICMNMKTVVTIAKRYQGLGLSLAELISAGNIGLIEAYSTFDPTRNTVKTNMMNAISCLGDTFTWQDLSNATKEALNYGTVYTKYVKKFSKKQTITKDELIEWINDNIKSAKFNSVASQRITAAIKAELTNYSSVIKQSKQMDSHIKELENHAEELEKELSTNDNELTSIELDNVKGQIEYLKQSMTLPKITRIDAPVVGNNINQGGEMSLENVITEFDVEDDESSEYERRSNKQEYYSVLDKLIGTVKARDKRIFFKSYGLGYPDKMSIQEIAKEEDISVARVSQIINSIMDNIKYNVVKYKIDKDALYQLI